jgi:hypothetical protein
MNGGQYDQNHRRGDSRRSTISGAVYAGGITDCSKQSTYQGDRPWCIDGPGSSAYAGG